MAECGCGVEHQAPAAVASFGGESLFECFAAGDGFWAGCFVAELPFELVEFVVHGLEFAEAIESRGRFGVELLEPVGVEVESPASFLERLGEVVDEVFDAGHEARGQLAEGFVAFLGGEALLFLRVEVELLVLDRAGRDREADRV